MRYGPGEAGPDLHVHRLHSDCFYIVDGEIVFGLGPGGETFTAAAGTFVAAPPMVGHTFRNESDADVRFLNFHAPGCRFDDYVRSRLDGTHEEAAKWFDSYDMPEDGGRPASDGVVRGPGEGDTISVGASSLLFKAEVSDGAGHLSLTENTIGPGFPGPPPHRHLKTLDSFYVLEGELTLQVGGETVKATTGTYAFVPPGNVHTFSNPGDTPVRALNLMAPGGFEQYLKEVAAVMPPDGTVDPAAMGRIASQYDFELAV
jgi:mannose-6-phosphate isomerase-like protein (cupin superfamily)